MWSQWKCFFLPIANKHAPLRTMRVRARSSPWITSTLKRRIHDRDILKIKVSKSKNPSDWMQFKKKRNIVNKEIRLAKQAYYQNTFNENKGDSKRTWQTINELTSRKSVKTTVTSLKVNRLSLTNHSELSDKFNPRRHKGGKVNLTPPSTFLALSFCSLTNFQKLWHNCSLFC